MKTVYDLASSLIKLGYDVEMASSYSPSVRTIRVSKDGDLISVAVFDENLSDLPDPSSFLQYWHERILAGFDHKETEAFYHPTAMRWWNE